MTQVHGFGGDDGGRTRDLRNAIAALSQLSYVPSLFQISRAPMLAAARRFVKFASYGPAGKRTRGGKFSFTALAGVIKLATVQFKEAK